MAENIKFHLKSLNIGLLSSYETQNPKYYNKIDGNTSISKKFDNFATLPILDFRESAEFNKNKDWYDINWFTKHFADIFRVQKWSTFYIETFVQGATIAQSLQGFIGLGLGAIKTLFLIKCWVKYEL